MAVVSLNTIKNWFKTGLIPTQAQFWDTWDSFRHKSEKVPVADVEGIDALLNAKADLANFNNHLSNPDAHPELLNSAKYVQLGQFIIWKHPTNNDPANKYILEFNDMVMGYLDVNWIHGFYIGGEINLLESYNTQIIL